MPTHEKIAGARSTSQATAVVVVTGGYIGDIPLYQGHVVLINRQSGQITAVWNSLCSNRAGLIDPPSSCRPATRRSSGALAPCSNRTGTSWSRPGTRPFNGTTNWGDSVLELSPNLRAAAQLHPDQPGVRSTTTTSTLAVPRRRCSAIVERAAAGGDGRQGWAHQAAQSRQAGRHKRPRRAADRRPAAGLPSPGPGAQVFSTPAVWTDPAGRINVYYATASGTADYVLRANDRLGVAWQ